MWEGLVKRGCQVVISMISCDGGYRSNRWESANWVSCIMITISRLGISTNLQNQVMGRLVGLGQDLIGRGSFYINSVITDFTLDYLLAWCFCIVQNL